MAGALLLTFAVYWPALHGGYIFDDAFYFLDNPTVHVSTFRLGDWINAALSQAGLNQFRALSMLSFAANYYLTGLDPFWPKLTNVLIHLGNGWLLFLTLRALLALRDAVRQETDPRPNGRPHEWTAAAIAGAWLLLPINLTGVAYVSQRMESLANLFVLAGLYVYLRARCDEFSGQDRSLRLWLGMLLSLALGFSAKESAVLLPLYSACAEFAISGFRNRDGRFSRPAVSIHLVLLLLPLIAGLAWISTWIFHSISGARTFSIGERLLTEPRVLLEYIHWTLLPNLSQLTFYHDDFRVSRGLFDPPTTALSILALCALIAIALWQRRGRPLLCLGILWFFAGHALTASVIPLELVFEHRNYFSSIGLLLAGASLIALEPGLKQPRLRVIVASGFIAFCAFTTFLRAEEWSNPLRLAYSEALKRPDSPRAQYELGRALVSAAGDDNQSPLIAESLKVLERAAQQPESGIAPLQALIVLNARTRRPIDPEWWRAIEVRLAARAPSQTDIESLVFLYRCQLRGECPQQTPELHRAFAAALDASRGNVMILSTYADFALGALGDPALAERLMRDAVAAKPLAPAYRVDLAKFLISTRQFEAASTEIAALAQMNRLGSLDPILAELTDSLRKAQRETPAPAESTDLRNNGTRG